MVATQLPGLGVHLVFDATSAVAVLLGALALDMGEPIVAVFFIAAAVSLVMNPLVVVSSRPWSATPGHSRWSRRVVLTRLSCAWLTISWLALVLGFAAYAFILWGFVTNRLPH